MNIETAVYLKSAPSLSLCPKEIRPEYAFIGRSNVGKSSLINYITQTKNLAKTSNTPGKTQLINFFLINNAWFLVDLPGFGYAKTSKKKREKFEILISSYISKRKQLLCTFLLIDIRLEPQKIDLEFMAWMAEKGLPFVLVFTKTDKLNKTELHKKLSNYKQELLKNWEELPEIFLTSAAKETGKEGIIDFIEKTNKLLI